MVSTRPIVGLPLCILNQESTPQAMFSGDSGFLEGSSPSIIVCERRSCPPTGAFLSSSSTETIRAPYEYVHLSLPINPTTESTQLNACLLPAPPPGSVHAQFLAS